MITLILLHSNRLSGNQRIDERTKLVDESAQCTKRSIILKFYQLPLKKVLFILLAFCNQFDIFDCKFLNEGIIIFYLNIIDSKLNSILSL